MLSLDGFPAFTRRLIYLAYALLAGMLLWLLLLLLLGDGRRGADIPSPAAMFAVFVVFSLAWSLLLTGALYARRSVRFGALFLYLIVTAVWVVAFGSLLRGYSDALLLFLPSILLTFVGILLLFIVPVFFVLRRRTRLRPATEFAILSLLVLGTYSTIYLQVLLMPDSSDDKFWTTLSIITLLPLLGLVGLLFTVLGLDLVELLYGAADLTAVFAGSRLRHRVLGGLLLLVLACQLSLGVWEAVEGIIRGSFWNEARGNLAALGFPCMTFVVWWVLEGRRPAPNDLLTAKQMFEIAKKLALLLVAIFFGVFVAAMLLVIPLFIVSRIVDYLGLLPLQEFRAGLNRSFENVGFIWGMGWQLLMGGLVLTICILTARRGYRAAALYLTIFGGSMVLFLSANVLGWWPERAGWGAAWARVDFWWAVMFTLIGMFWLSRGRLTTERIQRLLLLSLITFGLYGLGIYYVPAESSDSEVGTIGLVFVATGILALLWDLLTFGSWANANSGDLPRLSRIFLYLGFVVVCVTALDWAVIAGQLTAMETTIQSMAPFGLMYLGRPLLYATFVLTLALPATSLEFESSPATSTIGQSPNTGHKR